jgi:N-acetylmuramoyl-L-alanine amidase/glucan-binding YG repeat protein
MDTRTSQKWKYKGLLFVAVMAVMLLVGAVPATEVFAARNATTEKYVVVLDPGHGGSEDGAYAVHNGRAYREELINWKITQYAMEALQKESNIEVYLTKTQYETLPIEYRVSTAAKYNPDLLVSLHVNSADTSYTRGASVLISGGTYRSYLHDEELTLGKYVIQELNSLGISTRFSSTGGMEYRYSENGSTYPNGAIRDYYGIVAGSVEADFPGVIIEHAFITNYSDAVNYLTTDAQLKKLGEADAKAIIRYISELPAKEVKNGWYEENNNYYYYKSGVKQTNKLIRIDGEVYYVDSTGKRQTGWKTVNGRRYYFESDGAAHRGWKNESDGTRYYFNSKDGFLYYNTTLTSASGNIYIFGSDGKLSKEGWTYYKSNYYYTNKYGYIYKGLKKIDGKYYYFDPVKGYRYKNRKVTMDNGDIYYFEADGSRFEGGFKELKYNGVTYTYYFQTNGKAKKGWMNLDGKWYYFNSKTAFMYKGRNLIAANGQVYTFTSDGVCENR